MNSWLISFMLAALLAGGGYLYYKDTQKQIANLNTEITELTKERTKLERSLEVSENSLVILRKDLHDEIKETKNLENQFRSSQTRIGELREVLQAHNLTRLAYAKPGLIEKRMNDGTREVLEDLESATDSIDSN